MKLSCMLFPFHGLIANKELEPGALVESLAGAGVTALEPMLSNLEAEPRWREVLERAKEAGMAMSCVDVGVDFVGLREGNRAFENVKRGLELCAEIGCSIAMFPGTHPAEGMSNEEGRRIYSEGLAKAAEMARPLGVTTCIEDFGVYPTFACHSRHVLEVVTDAGPETRVAWDNGNFILADEMPLDALAPLYDRICHVHIKDFKLDPTGEARLRTPSGKAYGGCAIGEGDCQVRECVAELKRRGYDGWLSLEVGGPDPVTQALKGAEVLKEAWG